MAEITMNDVHKAEQDKAAVNAVNTLSNYVNCLGWNSRNFCVLMTQEHRTLQQSITALMIAWFRQLAENHERRFTDGRNEAAGEAAKVICKALDDAGIDSLPFI